MSNYLEEYNKVKKRYLNDGGTIDSSKENSETTKNLLEEVDKLAYVEPQEETVDLDKVFQKLEENSRTEQDINDEVKLILNAKYGTSKLEKERQNQSEVENLNSQIENNKVLNKQKVSSINKIYDNYVNNAENQALKRGLARSSIIINQLDGIEKERANELVENANSYSKTLSDLEKQIADSYSNLEQDLELLELDKASEEKTLLNQKLAELEKTKKEITEFNNNVEKLKIDYKLKLDSAKTNKTETEQAQIEQEKKDAFKKQYNLIYSTLKSLGKENALKELFANPKYAEYLGENINDLYYALKYSKY